MIQQQRRLTRREREGQGEAVHAYGTCPLSKALHHPGEGGRGRERERERKRERERGREINIVLGIHRLTIFFYQFTLSRSDSRNGINCRSSESDSSMNQLAIGIPLSS